MDEKALKREVEAAIGNLTKILQLNPKDAKALFERSACLTNQGDYAGANADLAQAIQLDPKNAVFHNELAWNLATFPKAETRNGAQAVKEATQACEMTGWVDYNYIDTLAAAYAEAGDLHQAVNWQEYGLSLPGLLAQPRDEGKWHLELYRRGVAYHRQL